MKILYISHYFYPHLGGVENHVKKISEILTQRGQEIKIVSQKNFDENLPYTESNTYYFGVNVTKIPNIQIKFVGLFCIWVWFLKNIKLFKDADIIHIHDVLLWVFPIKLIFPNKTYIVTFHGWEEIWPIPYKNILLRKISKIKTSYIYSVGNYVDKYYRIKSNKILYGAADIHDYKTPKDGKRIAYVGRLEENTGLLKFLKWLDKNPGYKVDFCGDGDKRFECEKYGTVHGFTDPNPFYKTCKTVVPGGYLAALEALNSGCDIKLFWNNKLKEDYWKMSPFWKLKGEELKAWARKQTWEKLANEYLDLYNSIK